MMCTHSETLWCIFLFRERTVLFESAGQYRHAFKVSQEYLSGSKEKPHLFLCVAVVFGFTARHCKLVPQTQASALIISQMKLCSNNVPCLTLLYQEIDELLPNLQGVHVFFSLPSRKLWGQRMILLHAKGQTSVSSSLSDWWERPNTPQLCIVLSVQPLVSIKTAK